MTSKETEIRKDMDRGVDLDLYISKLKLFINSSSYF